MNSSEIRESFLKHFEARDHRVVRSGSLIPAGDPTLLFTNAGMNQFKDTFLGLEKRDYVRAASSQKCLRVSGKHNDLDQVGRTARHHTFFEMLGNFSFGDYFKKDAIDFAWSWVTGTLGIPVDRLWVSVFETDDEAADLWLKVDGLKADRLVRLGVKDNFWAMGETGPCGPCSEIYYDQGAGVGCGTPECRVGCECDRYLEFWNLVFMQSNRQPDGRLEPLARPSIDTGAGLERISAIMQGVTSNYQTDLFMPLISSVARKAGVVYGRERSSDVCLQVIADHLRAITFLVAEGVVPSNEKRGYVLRRVIRRALTFGKTLKLKAPFLDEFTGDVVEGMKATYPELAGRASVIKETCRREEEAFEATLARGVDFAEEVYSRHKGREMPASEAADLYTTYGLSFEIQEALALPFGTSLPSAEVLEAEMEKHRERARSSWQGESGSRLPGDLVSSVGGKVPEFLGYESLEVAGARVEALFDSQGKVEQLQEGQSGFAVLDRTPFYAESGGQVGDTGRLTADDGSEAEVEETTAPAPGLVVHHVRVLSGALVPGGVVTAAVNGNARASTMRNHTATHLLHAALRKVLGKEVQQAGSYVGPDRLRFDFNFPGPVSPGNLAEVEREVNEQILLNTPVEKAERSYDEAIEAGAVALFGEKYGDKVRVVSVPGYSQELCGGTHCHGTGDIGQMMVISEKGIAAGVRRIEALTGMAALGRARENETILRGVEATVNKKRDGLVDGIAALHQETRTLKREMDRLKLRLAQAEVAGRGGSSSEPSWEEVQSVRLMVRSVSGLDRSGMRNLADNLKREIESGVVVLGSADDGKVALLVAVTDDLLDRLDARVLIRDIASIAGGGGGGRPNLAEAGGKHPDKLAEALQSGPGALAKLLEGAT